LRDCVNLKGISADIKIETLIHTHKHTHQHTHIHIYIYTYISCVFMIDIAYEGPSEITGKS